MSERVLVIGIDGASWDVIDPLAGAGRLPALSALMNDGAWSDLLSLLEATHAGEAKVCVFPCGAMQYGV